MFHRWKLKMSFYQVVFTFICYSCLYLSLLYMLYMGSKYSNNCYKSKVHRHKIQKFSYLNYNKIKNPYKIEEKLQNSSKAMF